MPRILFSCQEKGGVGKSTIVRAIAEAVEDVSIIEIDASHRLLELEDRVRFFQMRADREAIERTGGRAARAEFDAVLEVLSETTAPLLVDVGANTSVSLFTITERTMTMPDNNIPLDTNTILRMPIEPFADIAIDAALWLVREAMDAIANQTAFDPDPENCFKVLGRLPAIRQLRDLTEEQRHDLFVEGFRRIHAGAEATFELLLANHKELLWEGFRNRWNEVKNELPLASS
jgi:hypothetical protein